MDAHGYKTDSAEEKTTTATSPWTRLWVTGCRVSPGGFVRREMSPLDTGVGAQLLTVEDATGVIALARARAKAQYALAVWALLEPPKQWKLLPDVGIWVEQPTIQLGQRFKRREHKQWIPRERVKGNSIRFWGEYDAPQADLLQIPFNAIENLEKRCTQRCSALPWLDTRRAVQAASC